MVTKIRKATKALTTKFTGLLRVLKSLASEPMWLMTAKRYSAVNLPVAQLFGMTANPLFVEKVRLQLYMGTWVPEYGRFYFCPY